MDSQILRSRRPLNKTISRVILAGRATLAAGSAHLPVCLFDLLTWFADGKIGIGTFIKSMRYVDKLRADVISLSRYYASEGVNGPTHGGVTNVKIEVQDDHRTLTNIYANEQMDVIHPTSRFS